MRRALAWSSSSFILRNSAGSLGGEAGAGPDGSRFGFGEGERCNLTGARLCPGEVIGLGDLLVSFGRLSLSHERERE